MSDSSKIHVIVVAAGSGHRFGAPVPKQFCELSGKPVLLHTLAALRRELPRATITLVLNPDWMEYWRELAAGAPAREDRLVAGGATRAESVQNALRGVKDADIVLVHDGVRPFVDKEIIEGLLTAMSSGADAAIPAILLTDSVWCVTPDSKGPVDRSTLRAVQTPQAFPAALLAQAYEKAAQTGYQFFTDDSSVLACLKGADSRIVLTPGNPDNIKITNPRDIAIAETILRFRD